jgi:hypothetical protein
MIRSLASAGALIAVLVACQSTVVPTPTASPGAPAAATSAGTSTPPDPSAAPTTSPSPSFNRPDPGADVPPIADPYWLGVGGPSSVEVKDAAGNVIRSDHGMGYQVLLGGGIEGNILINGRAVGNLEWAVSQGQDGNDLEKDPLQEQVGHLSKNLTVTTKRQGGVDVTFVDSNTADLEYHAAYWWATDHSRWFTLTAFDQADMTGIVTALLGP